MKMLNQHYREKFGCKVYKLSLDGGFTCPNRDGTLSTGGCIFCSASGGGSFAEKDCGSIEAQLEKAKIRVESKNKDGKYIAYFQAFTNTYAPVDRLRELYYAAMKPADIVGLAVGTRPDCLGDDVIALLARLNRIKPVWVELGLQTIHEETTRYIRRGYPLPVYEDAVARLKAAGMTAVMLTGDEANAARAVADSVGIEEVHARLLPQQKLEKLRSIRGEKGAVMFVGDGINDAPVLAGADVGAAMGNGADAAIEAADVVFMTADVRAIPEALEIARRTGRIAWQNVIFALAVKFAVMLLGLMGFASMWMAVFADSGVAMLCVLNSIRLLYRKK